MTVAVILADLDQWLAANAPRTLSLLHPPASQEQLQELESRLGFALLPEVASTLLWHNGATEEMGGFQLAPTYWLTDAARVAGDASRLRATARASNPEAWDVQWVPLAADRCGGYLVVDHTPDVDTGRTFLWEPENGEDAMGSWTGLAELCSELRFALLRGAPWLDNSYQIVDGGVEWE
ncbi:SMI1/KNR4 family protein [Dactylosporangium sp. NPDC006015]|uniref:SMI1/KNR4 family protein n=1 Tax=Dactylosporangium sp. NPDC006015 TaxID=3154576 RepID=UPI0033ACBC42